MAILGLKDSSESHFFLGQICQVSWNGDGQEHGEMAL